MIGREYSAACMLKFVRFTADPGGIVAENFVLYCCDNCNAHVLAAVKTTSAEYLGTYSLMHVQNAR